MKLAKHGRRNLLFRVDERFESYRFHFHTDGDSSMVERPAVNRKAVGSGPTLSALAGGT